MCVCLTIRYEVCATKVRGVALINLANRYLHAFRHRDLCYYTNRHLCLKTGAYGVCISVYVCYYCVLVIYYHCVLCRMCCQMSDTLGAYLQVARHPSYSEAQLRCQELTADYAGPLSISSRQ